MKNKTYKTVLYFTLSLLPLLVVCILFSSLPEKIPMHYNFNGEINRWGTKYESFILPIITIIFAFIFQLLKFTKNNVANAKPYEALSLGFLFIFNIFNFIFLYYCFYPRIFGATNLINAIMCVMLIIFGNFFPKLKQNSFVGLRLYWTLNNEIVWYKTHRLAGIVWVIGGSIMLILCLFMPKFNSTIITLGGLAIISIIPSVYSYIIYKKISINLHN